jgi:nucleotide-binding universal stress UspA family protein
MMAAADSGPRQKEQAMPGITVGVDGSENSQRALEWAMKEAAIRHATLNVVAVHEVATNHWTGNPMIVPEDRADEDKARKAAEAKVSAIASQLGDGQPASVSVRAVSGIPTKQLIEESQHSDLIVVGSRGGGGFARLLMGSVSSQVVHHAACPVVVVR